MLGLPRRCNVFVKVKQHQRVWINAPMHTWTCINACWVYFFGAPWIKHQSIQSCNWCKRKTLGTYIRSSIDVPPPTNKRLGQCMCNWAWSQKKHLLPNSLLQWQYAAPASMLELRPSRPHSFEGSSGCYLLEIYIVSLKESSHCPT